MVMTYVGTLKSRLWSPVFRFLGVSAATVRVPAVLLGSFSVWLFYRLLSRTLGPKAAVTGCGLLATDPLYLLTIRWDWGPVVLQHTLLLAGLLAIVTWFQERKLWWLAFGFFAFGLAMWDKALFIWSLAGLAIAAAAVFPRELLQTVRPRTAAIAIAAFGAGAFPLIVYNVRNNGITFRSNVEHTNQDLLSKLPLLRDTVDGSSMFGSLTRPEWEGPARHPLKWYEIPVVGFARLTGVQHHTVQLLCVILSIALLPLVWRTPSRRAVLFSLICVTITWLQMASVKNGGTGVHHTILLWPAPALIIAATAGALTNRMTSGWLVTAALTSVLMISGMLVSASYYHDMLLYGGTMSWTDAFYPAIAWVKTVSPAELCIVEWGFFDNSRLFTQGRLELSAANDPTLNDDERRFSKAQITKPGTLFITHTKGNESEPGRTGHVLSYAAELGYEQTNLRTFMDSNGRPMIEAFSLTPRRQ